MPRALDSRYVRYPAVPPVVLAQAGETVPAAQNHLIELLPGNARRSLLSICEPVILSRSDVLSSSGTPTRHVYFPVDAFISLINEIDSKPVLEVGMVGREGMVGVELVLGVPITPLYTLVQGSGSSWRIGTRAFNAELAGSPPLQRALNRYIYILMYQLASSAGCLRFHEIGPRLARWLLMTQDRAHSDTFRVTHEFLAYMLGVRRVGVTLAAQSLQQRGMISYHRGAVHVLDRQALKEAACSCYAANQNAYSDLMN